MGESARTITHREDGNMSILHVPMKDDYTILQHCEDGDIDTGASQMCEYASFAQMASAAVVEIVGSEVADTSQKVTVIGIDSAGRRAIEEISLNGTTVVAGSLTWRYVENAYLDTEATGTVTIQHLDNTDVNLIAIGALGADVIQFFPGDDHIGFISEWHAGIDLSTADGADNWAEFQLRWYPDDADCLDTGDGFRLLDSIQVDADDDASSDVQRHVKFDPPIRIPEGGWVTVWGLCEDDNQVAFAGMSVKPVLTKRIENVQT